MSERTSDGSLKQDLNVFVSFWRFHSAFSLMFSTFLCMNVLMCVHADAYSLYQIDEKMFMSLMIYTRSFVYRCTEVELVVSLPTLRLLLLPAPLGGNVAIQFPKKPRARLARLLSQVGAHLHSTLYCVTTSPRATAGY